MEYLLDKLMVAFVIGCILGIVRLIINFVWRLAFEKTPAIATPKTAPTKRPMPPPYKHPMSGFVFKNAEAFFQYQCKYGQTDIIPDRICFGIVDTDMTEFVSRHWDRSDAKSPEQWVEIRLASEDGGRSQIAVVNADKGRVAVGDLVAWQAARYSKEAGWNGRLIGVCAPEFNDHGVKVLRHL